MPMMCWLAPRWRWPGTARAQLFSGLTHLPRSRYPAGVARRSRGRHLRAHRIWPALQLFERLGPAQATPAGDDEPASSSLTPSLASV